MMTDEFAPVTSVSCGAVPGGADRNSPGWTNCSFDVETFSKE